MHTYEHFHTLTFPPLQCSGLSIPYPTHRSRGWLWFQGVPCRPVSSRTLASEGSCWPCLWPQHGEQALSDRSWIPSLLAAWKQIRFDKNCNSSSQNSCTGISSFCNWVPLACQIRGSEYKIFFTSDHRWVLKQCHPPGSVWGSERRVHWLDSGSWETSGQAFSEPWSCVTVFCLCFDGFHTFKMPTPRESDGAYESCKHVELCCRQKKQQLSNCDDVTTQPFFLTASIPAKTSGLFFFVAFTNTLRNYSWSYNLLQMRLIKL